jgi:outer membrane protein assembly factor BamB
MSTTAESERAVSSGNQTTSPETATPRKPLRLWLPTLVLLGYWIVDEGGRQIDLGMFQRFSSRFIALLALILFFLVWGFTRRHFTFKQRLAGFAIIVGLLIVAGLAADPTVRIFGMAMMGVPIVLSLATVWLWFTRQRSAGVELAGVAVSCLVVFGTISLLRWEGLDGLQRSIVSWRWTPTAEEQFLSERKHATPASELPAEIVPAETTETDWTSFRGGDRDSVVAGVTPGDWSHAAPHELWRKRVGPAWSSVIAVGDALITQEQRGTQEAVVCYNAVDGAELWAHLSDDRFEETLSGTGPRATPSASGDRIVAYGAKGDLVCLKLATGELIWSRKVLEETGAAVPQWGLSVSPLIIDGLVVVFAGGKDDQGLVAYDLMTGEPKWHSAAGTMTYCSPQTMTIAGVRQIVMQDEQSLSGYDFADGRRLWSHPSPNAASFQPMIQPHLVGEDRLIVGWGPGTLCLQVARDGDAWKLAELWDSNKLKPGFNDFVVHKGYIYGLDDGILCCVNAEDGKRVWKDGRYGFGQILFLADANELLIVSEKGDVIRVAASPDGLEEHGTFHAIDGKTWNHPVVAHGRLVVRNAEEMACFELAGPAKIASK